MCGGYSLDRKVPSECVRIPVSIKGQWECDKETGVSVAGEVDMGERPLKTTSQFIPGLHRA